jgi:multimeric flavodoxin WrbA
MDAPDPQAEAVFRHLVGRNTLNFYAGTAITGLLYSNQSEAEIRRRTQGWLDDLAKGKSSAPVTLPDIRLAEKVATPPRRALLLVGSPRTKKSTSNSLGSYLLQQLEAQGLLVDTRYIYTTLRSKERWSEVLETLAAANLVLLAFPLYVDTLPAPVIEALERIAAYCNGQPASRQQRFAAIVNCGFPEARHMENAVAVCALFARQAGLEWAGALRLAGGEGLVHGTPLAELDGRAISLKKSLELAAAALGQGERIPQAAVDLLARPVIPAWLYRVFGGFGWKKAARRYGAEKQLRRKAYLE